MQINNLILIPAILFSFVTKSQTRITQKTITLSRSRDSCIVITEISNDKKIVFNSKAKCKKAQSDSCQLVEWKRVKLINQNYNWKNNQ